MEHLHINEERRLEPKRHERIDELLEASIKSMKALSHPEMETQPEKLHAEKMFTAIGKSLWNATQNIDQARTLIDDQSEKGWTENELKQLPGWETEHGNAILSTLLNLCRIGAMTNKDGQWMKTDFCEQIRSMLSSDWPETSAQVQAALKYSKEFGQGMGEIFDTAWKALQEPHIHHIVTELLPRKISVNHDELLRICGDDGGDEHCHHGVLKAIASLATLGAIEHHGHVWNLNLYGLWLVSAADSPINKRFAA